MAYGQNAPRCDPLSQPDLYGQATRLGFKKPSICILVLYYRKQQKKSMKQNKTKKKKKKTLKINYKCYKYLTILLYFKLSWPVGGFKGSQLGTFCP